MAISFGLKRHAVVIVLALHVPACVSQIPTMSDYAGGWIGRSIDDYNRVLNRGKSYANQIGWQEKTYPLPNGNMVYVAPERPDCFIHWEVNKTRTIVGYKTEGARCY